MSIDIDPPDTDASLDAHEVSNVAPHHDDLDTDVEHPPLARIGRAAHSHRRFVIAAWAVLAIGLGVFAPKLEHALSGAMWEVNGSESLAARDVIDEQFGGLSSQSAVVVIQSQSTPIDDPTYQQVISEVNTLILAEPGFGQPMPAQPGMDGMTVMIQAGADVDPTEAVRAAERLGDDIAELSTEVAGDEIEVALTGSPAFWDDFNAVNREGMMKAEILTWPVTAIILVIAFGTLAAAGLPLVLTAAGLLASMGVLYGITQTTDLSIWTLNFAMMFALALGIDYALFIVTRYRAALHAHPEDPQHAAGIAMDTAGKAVLFSGITVLISLSAVLLVPIPAFRSMAAGMMLSVSFVLLAALTLLPALLGPGIDRFALPWHSKGDHHSEFFARLADRIQARKVVVAAGSIVVLLALALPLLGLKTGMPGITVLPEDEQARQGYDMIADGFGPGGPGPIQVIVPAGEDPQAVADQVMATDGIVMAFPPQPGADGASIIQAVGGYDPVVRRGAGADPDPADRAARRCARRWSGRRELRPRPNTQREGTTGHRRRARARLLAVDPRPAGDHRRLRRCDLQPALGRRCLRRRCARVPARYGCRPARIRQPGLPHLVGAAVLLRPRVRDLDGLHGVPAGLHP